MSGEDIIKLAFELGEALAQSDEIEQVKNMQAKITEDTRAYDLIVNYQNAKIKLDDQLNEGKIVSKTDEDHLQILEDQLSSNETIQQLMMAQEKFDNLMQAVYYAINSAIAGEDTCSSGCGSCDCGCGSM
ncbi:MAG TPA: YlbF family regulator [Syntrophomonadaceae bacterium]|nr:YlbF family regulator [Syntrophomonadaceae bacterium]HNX29327.1 YlbF family regulator [Syntrophomonadaceae bacterium]HPR93023.1 YlbF family regulator [Syntrophomonadaceae bacterium]